MTDADLDPVIHAPVRLRITGIRAVLASGHDELLAWGRTDELGAALEHLAAAALVLGRRHGLEHTCWWPWIIC